MKRRRSPRSGWVLVQLVDGVWRRVCVGDREELKERHNRWCCDLILHDRAMFHPGHCSLLFDALGQRRDEFPAFPRLVDGTRIETPGALPEDGAAPTPRPVRAPRPISDAWTTDLSAEVKP